MRAAALLGGVEVLGCRVETALEAHDLIVRGIPCAALLHLIDEVANTADGEALASAFGSSRRTLRRQDMLAADQGDRLWRFAHAVVKVTAAMGTREAAGVWFMTPLMALDGRRPIELLATAAGAAALDEHLTRIEFGVHS